jgi:hypothetical protein
MATVTALERRPWAQANAFIRAADYFKDGKLREEIIACVQQIRSLGTNAYEYIPYTHQDTRITLAVISQKASERADIPSDTEVFQALQDIGVSLLRLPSLTDDQRRETQRFTALVGSMTPAMCLEQYSRITPTKYARAVVRAQP